MNVIISTILALFIALTIPRISLAEDDSGPQTFLIKRPSTLHSVAQKLIARYKIRYGNRIDEFKQDLVKWNPHVTNWQNIPLLSKIYIEYPYPVYISHPYAPKIEYDQDSLVINGDAENPIGENRFTLFSMVTTSAGNFEEKLKTREGSIRSAQNSPYSVGLGTTFFFDKANKMISSSFYWSSLKPSSQSNANVNSTQAQLNLKAEYGLNLYYQQLISTSELSAYGGLDYENFSTFNTQEYANGDDLSINQNQLIYVTAGLGKTFFINDQRLLLKASLSQSVNSKSSSIQPDAQFSGQRFLLYTSYKGVSRFTYHLMFKRHMLEGPTKLTINRFGIGIGFVIF
jgi:hypothetical protein